MMPASAGLRVLVISRVFPPVRGVGSLRTAGFARELSAMGWTVTVLTVHRRSLAPSLRDDSLEELVPAEVRRLEARDYAAEIGARLRRRRSPLAAAATESVLRRPQGTLPGRIWRWFTLPDLAFTWMCRAIVTGWRASRTVSVIYSCGLPLGSHLAAGILARVARRAWVCDFRDPYVWPGVRYFATPFHQACGRWLEQRVVRAADHVLVANDALVDHYREHYPETRRKLSSITNGYDGRVAEPQPPDDGPLRLAHAGQFHDDAALRTLVDALAVARRHGRQVELVMIGAISPAQHTIIHASDARDNVRLVGRVPHSEVEAMLARSDLLVTESSGAIARMAVRAKIFEYAQASKPIVALTDRGSALDAVISRHGLGYVSAPDDVEALAVLLAEMEGRKAGGRSLFPVDSPDIVSLSRAARAKELDRLLRQVAAAGGRREALARERTPAP